MTDDRRAHSGRSGFPWRPAGWGGAALLLLLPLIANAPWTLSDFVIMGILLGGTGIAIELAVRASGDLAFRGGAVLAVAAAFLLIWVNGAVGFLGDEDNPANLVFFGVIGIAFLGSVLAGFRAAGMAQAMFAAAGAQVLVGAVALAAGFASPGPQGLYEVTVGTSFFAALWLFSAALFRKAAGGRASAREARR